MLFGVVYLILCGVNHTRGHGVNIVAMACLYFVRIISITDVTVGGVNDGRYVSVCGGAVNNILARGKNRGGGTPPV